MFASGDACASADPVHFFAIEPGNDVAGLLDFARRLKSGPVPGLDRVRGVASTALLQCFAPEGMATTRILRAHSWREPGGRRDRYQVALACRALEDRGDVVAIGTRGEDAIAWQVSTVDKVDVDEAAPGKTSGR